MARCVIYTRVSTTPQASGDGLRRQLDECIRYARDHKLNIAGVYTDICSGAGAMPNRSIAYREHIRLNCPILVESGCRWSRHRYEDEPLKDANVIYASDTAREMRDRLAEIISKALSEARDGRGE
jgi:DNA invertase Pin-like site-specific DNA recombinase